MAELDVADEGLIDGCTADEDVVAVHGEVIAGDPAAAGGVALGVGIDEQRALLCDGERGSEVHSGGRLTDSTFLVGDSEDACQDSSARRVRGEGKYRPVFGHGLSCEQTNPVVCGRNSAVLTYWARFYLLARCFT